ncbi:MAG TPA: hypothetical protein VF625_19095 [Longimicrobium sp.]|jgi:pimeloyl-ACP methyl ester carboxylesterase
MIASARTARFLTAFLRGGKGAISEREMTLDVGGEAREATLYLPDHPRRVPGWVVLHGLTVPGRKHVALTRFVRSLAASGAVVLVPDIPAWRELRLDVEAARATLEAATVRLADHPRVQPGGVGAIGFSFGATQALMAAADPRLHSVLRAVVGFGGYCDLGRMVRALFTGEHDWSGESHRMDPDPYGRWVVAGNFLTLVPGYEGMERVRRGAMELGIEAGRRGAFAWEAGYDAMKAEIRATLSEDELPVWDILAAPARAPVHDLAASRELADRFTAAALRVAPGLDPLPRLPELRGRIVLSHGRTDRLIPFTETLRLAATLPRSADVSTTITGLFAHSGGAGGLQAMARARESLTFIQLMNQALGAL